MKCFSLISVAILSMIVLTSTAYAEKTDWFKGKERHKIQKMMKGKLLHEIECRDQKTAGLHLARDEFRVTYSENPDKIRFLWAIGNQFGRYKAYAEKHGFKLVSINQYVRKSGLKIRCAVWHKAS